MDWKNAKHTITFRCTDEQLEHINKIKKHYDKGPHWRKTTNTEAVLMALQDYSNRLE